MIGKQVEVFLADDTPGALTTADITDCTGSIVSARRSNLGELLARKEAEWTGVCGACLHQLIASHLSVPIRGMGVPDGWFANPFWSGGHNV